jgi:hypothetical protein
VIPVTHGKQGLLESPNSSSTSEQRRGKDETETHHGQQAEHDEQRDEATFPLGGTACRPLDLLGFPQEVDIRDEPRNPKDEIADKDDDCFGEESSFGGCRPLLVAVIKCRRARRRLLGRAIVRKWGSVEQRRSAAVFTKLMFGLQCLPTIRATP